MDISIFPAYLMRRKDNGTIRCADENMRLLAEAAMKNTQGRYAVWEKG